MRFEVHKGVLRERGEIPPGFREKDFYALGWSLMQGIYAPALVRCESRL